MTFWEFLHDITMIVIEADGQKFSKVSSPLNWLHSNDYIADFWGNSSEGGCRWKLPVTPRRLLKSSKVSFQKCSRKHLQSSTATHPLHRIEFGPPKFFSKLSGGANFRKACRSRKKESKPSEITCKQLEPARTIFKIEKRREFVQALCNEQCPKNSFKRL